MDIVWLVAGAVFFLGSWGLVQLFGSLNAED